MDIKVIFFKKSGKYYTNETLTVPENITSVYKVITWLAENVLLYPNMHLVAMLDEYELGFPIMIPADRRNW